MNSIMNNPKIKEIPISDIENLKIGHAEDSVGGTGCSVLLFDVASPAGVDVRGSAPASRETDLLNPTSSNNGINAVVLSGGSAFGLDAAAGVMEYLEERNIGFDVGVTVVPIVVQSSLFDLPIGDYKSRPDKAMGYKACEDAQNKRSDSGCIGAGMGATVGKILGHDRGMKSGFGTFAVQIGDLKVGAVVALNALGDIFDIETGEKIAGVLSEDKTHFQDTIDVYVERFSGVGNLFTQNTTIGAIVTNGKFDKVQMKKIASMAHNGYARSIRPVHTTADGDTIHAVSCGEVTADVDVVGTLAAEVMARAIRNAIKSSKSMFGIVAACDLK